MPFPIQQIRLSMNSGLQAVKHFSIFYDANNDDLQKHSIGAKELGEAVVEMAKMIEQADLLLNNQQQTVSLQITAKPIPGSFGLEFDLVTLVPAAIDVLKYVGLTVASSAIVGGSAFAVARQMRDRKVLSINTTTGSDQVTMQLDGAEITCDKQVAELVTDPIIRSAMTKIINKPLSDKPSPVFKVMAGTQEVFRLVGHEIAEYAVLPRDSLLLEQSEVITTNITFTRVSFVSSTGWKMIFDKRELAVVMKDEAFMAAVRASNQQFSKDDLFEVELEVTNKETAGGFKTRYVITRVLRHRVRSENKIVPNET
ncbi:hypothetical protein [Aeromonas veronii]|uniref:hypothetical protein n=1 Tax=Aeromonas veronii TaxID=654 RepID=UPI002443B367|nr:hypothetical protein [Aeromonas veronii]